MSKSSIGLDSLLKNFINYVKWIILKQMEESVQWAKKQ